jgi:hypothetical protein
VYDWRVIKMEAEEYKDIIIKLVNEIDDCWLLNQILKLVKNVIK